MRIKRLSVRMLTAFLLTVLVLSLSGLTTAFAGSPEVKLNVKNVELIKGDSFDLKLYNKIDNQTVSFVSADEEIARVDENGRISAIACGDTTVRVTVYEEDKIAASFNVSVSVGLPAYSIRFVKRNIEIPLGAKRILKTLVFPGNTLEKPLYYSEDRSIATVSSSGRVVAKSVGTTYIYVIIGNGLYDVCKVVVTDTEEKEEETAVPTAEPTGAPAEHTFVIVNYPEATPSPVPTPAPVVVINGDNK